jgi:protein required for attachment to host cells
MNAWILICDASRARIFETNAESRSLRLVRELAHAESRAKDHELVSDTPGRMSKGYAHVPVDAASPHRVEAERFAKQIARTLHDAADKRSYDAAAIVAPPHFLGVLRDTFCATVSRRIVTTLDRDLTHLSDRELPQHLGEIWNALTVARLRA